MNRATFRFRHLASLLIATALLVTFLIPAGARADDTGWRGEYFTNPHLWGTPAFVRTDSSIHFDWGYGSPDPRIPADQFSVRWTRTVYFEAGRYRFTTITDDGVRLYVNGRRIINEWYEQATTAHHGEIDLPAGHHTVVMEYYENLGLAVAKLSWQRISPHEPPITQWRGEYFNNPWLSGTPTLVRNDPQINFDWGLGSPHPSIPADRFSVRWTRTMHFDAGRYRFTTINDDGVRLYVSGKRIIDAWYDQAATAHHGEIDLPAGSHTVVMEYYENLGYAVAKLSWQRISPPTEPPITQWRGEYFNNPWLSGTPTLVRNDPQINFDWGLGSPHPSIPADRFSVRWTRTVHFDAGRYRFTTVTDDGVRLFVNGQRIINAWYDQAATAHHGEIDLPAGSHTVVMEYYENIGQAVAKLSWQRVSLPTPPPVQPPTTTWRGEYFSNRHLSGTPTLVRNDAEINFNWGYGSPDARIPVDRFSVRWTRSVFFEEGRYEFATTTDDGVRLYVNGRLIIDKWHDQSATMYKVTTYLPRGHHVIRMEYYENYGQAVAKLSWKGPLEVPRVGNLITAVRPTNSWIKVYQRTADGRWNDINPRGYGLVDSSGYLKIDGLPVDFLRYGWDGHPYRVELWAEGRMIRSVGNVDIGQPEFRIRPNTDNRTPWGVPAP